jgi:hypothetical protein
MSNNPKVLIEFDPDEVKWLADRLHELRQGWLSAELLKAQGIQERGKASENEMRMLQEMEQHRKMEARLRNRILNKASEQGFGDL